MNYVIGREGYNEIKSGSSYTNSFMPEPQIVPFLKDELISKQKQDIILQNFSKVYFSSYS